MNDTQGIMFVPTTKTGYALNPRVGEAKPSQTQTRPNSGELKFEYIIDFMHPQSYEHTKSF